MRSAVEIEVSAGDRARLEAIAAAPGSPQKHVWRARIILLSGDGVGTMAIARQAGVAKPTVWRWQERFMTEGMAGLLREKSRPPGIAPLPAETVDQVLSLTGAPPPGEATHWTVRAMAKAVGISRASVQRIWQAHGLQPHRLKAFKLSRDPAFAAKLRDIVGLCLVVSLTPGGGALSDVKLTKQDQELTLEFEGRLAPAKPPYSAAASNDGV